MVDPDEISVTELYRLVSVPLLPRPPARLAPRSAPDPPPASVTLATAPLPPVWGVSHTHTDTHTIDPRLYRRFPERSFLRVSLFLRSCGAA